MTILEYLKENNITIKSISDEIKTDSSSFSKVIRNKKPLGLTLYKRIKNSRLKDCSLDNLTFTTELQDYLINEADFNRLDIQDDEKTHIDLDFRLSNKEQNKIIDIDRDITKELNDSLMEIQRLTEENKKLFKINFKYANQIQEALDCIDDLDINLQLLRAIINKGNNLQNPK